MKQTFQWKFPDNVTIYTGYKALCKCRQVFTHPKMKKPEPNVYPTILGGFSRGFWSPFLYWGTQSAICCHLKTGTFGKSTRFQVPKSGTSGAETKKTRPLFNANIPPKWCRTLLFFAFSTFEWVLSQSKNLSFFGPFFQLKRAKRKN